MNKLSGEKTVNFATKQYNPINGKVKNVDDDKKKAIKIGFRSAGTSMGMLSSRDYDSSKSPSIRHTYSLWSCVDTSKSSGAWECVAHHHRLEMPIHRILLPKTSNYSFQHRFSMFCAFVFAFFAVLFCVVCTVCAFIMRQKLFLCFETENI